MTRLITSCLLVICASSTAFAAPPIVDAGNYTLRSGLGNQEIQIYVSGGDLVEAMDLYLRIGDGTSGPTIQSVDVLSGTIFDGYPIPDPAVNPYVELRMDGRMAGAFVAIGVGYHAPAGNSFVPGDSALLATMVVDTSDVSPGTWELDLAFDYGTLSLNTTFPLVPTTLVNGTLSIGNPLGLGDFDFNGAVNSADVDDLVQALRHPANYESNRSVNLSTVGLTIGDFNGDGTFNDEDARAFADDPGLAGVLGLPTRQSRYFALDQADDDWQFGTGDGNFFSTVFGGTLPTSYQWGDSRGDLNGDGVLGAADIDHVLRNGPVGDVDLDVLVGEILETFVGDIDLDGTLDLPDLQIMESPANWGIADGTAGWSNGDLNGDGNVNDVDRTILVTSEHWPYPVPEPAALVSLLSGLAVLSLVLRRRRS